MSQSAGQRGNIALRWSADIGFRGLSINISPRWGEAAVNLLLQFEAVSRYAPPATDAPPNIDIPFARVILTCNSY
ncbi:MAG: hypothetical protein QOF62_1370 [Pyrinomonadaceae bacterium]|jgi:hypothetical protein|nr:hypothetical protein [Pyrinomonadaceae bacterium]